ncbi:MAG: protein kinase [Blastocatellia bacterium]|nr:protein kinase [Blastocatellia bacterium]
MLTPGTVLQQRYQIEKLLAQGGMGAVYKATDRRLGNVVAVKETLFHEDALRRAFEREARLLAKLFHPALPKVTDHFSEGDGQFLVMEYVPGDDLSELLNRQQGSFPLEQVLEWADQLLEVLEYLHSQQPPVIHRDIKPANLKLTPEGHILLIDFGMARGAGSSVAGYSVNYAPPEQIDQISTDGRSDLFAVGATLYHLLTRQTPACSIRRAVTVGNGEADPLVPLKDLNSQVPQPIASLIMQCMALERNQRPISATHLRNSLRQLRAESRMVQSASTLVERVTEPGAGGTTPYSIPAQAPSGGAPAMLGVGPTVAAAGVGTLRATVAGIPQPDSLRGLAGTVAAAGIHRPAAPTVAAGQPFPEAFQPVIPVADGPPPLPVQIPVSMTPKTRKSGLGGILSAVGLVLLLAAGGGYWWWNRPADDKKATLAAVTEILRYDLELKTGASGQRVTGKKELSSGTPFKFHFESAREGYLYLVAPGEGNVAQTFLTNQPLPETGVESNRLTKNNDFVFPKGNENWIGLRSDTYSTPFTVVFSTTRLTHPALFDQQAGRKLSQSEQQEWEDFLKSSRPGDLPATQTQDEGKVAVSVTLAEGKDLTQPLVFEVVLKTKAVGKKK